MDNRLNYASFITTFEIGVNEADRGFHLAEMLLGCIFQTVKVYRKKTGEQYILPNTFKADEITKYKTQVYHIPQTIVKAAKDERVIKNAPAYFEKNVLSFLEEDREKAMFTLLRDKITKADIAPEKKKELLDLSEPLNTEGQKAKYLAAVFLYAITQENKRTEENSSDIKTSSKKRGSKKQSEETEDIKPLISDAPPALNTIPAAVELIGREKAIQDIQKLLEKNDIVYIQAGGGVGKTAVAKKIANQIKKDILSGSCLYQHVAWITSSEDLKKDLTSLHRIPSVISAQSVDEKYNAATVFLQTTPTFLVIDNMDTPPTRDEVNELNTIAGKTKILITSRAEIPIGEPHNLENMDHESALVLFYNYFQEGKSLTIDQIKARADCSYAENIVEAATYNALLVELIGKMAYQDHWKLDVLSKKLEVDVFSQDSRHKIPTVYGRDEKLLMRIQKLYEMSKLSDRQKEIMSFISLFPPEHSIFFDVFEWAGFENDAVDNLGELKKRGWIERDDEGYLIHTMVKGSIGQQQGKSVFDEDRYEELIRELCKTEQYIPRDMVYTKVRERIVVPETICRLLVDQGSKKQITSTLYNNLAGVHHVQGNYAEALKYYEKALTIRKKMLGESHPYIAMTYNDMTKVCLSRGDNDMALSLCKNALMVCEDVLGTEHPVTATTYNNMAVTYTNLGYLDEALRYYRMALAIREKAFGTEDPDIASTYNNMANMYHTQGNYDEALRNHRKALAICEKVLGTEHPSTATTYHNMAEVYHVQGNHTEAMKYFEKALTIREKVLGPEHPDTASTYFSMAQIYRFHGYYDEALRYYEKALAIRVKVLGIEHPITVMTYDDMVGTFDVRSHFDEELRYYEKALAINKKVLGTENPYTATTYNDMASMFCGQGNYVNALNYYEKALAINEEKLGTEHPSTATTYWGIAIVYMEQGKFDEALEYIEKALTIDENMLVTEHLDTATMYNDLTESLDNEEDTEVLMFCEKLVAIFEKVLGAKQPSTMTKYNDMAGGEDQGDYTE